jgi:hypothetical protein
VFTEERALWLYRHFLWLEQNLPGWTDPHRQPLILPTVRFYPQRHTLDHAFAESIFETTRGYMGMSRWKCRLVPQSDEEREAARALSRGAASSEMSYAGAAGTFSVGDGVEVTYSPSLLRDPTGLVAVLAHELCHYLMATLKVEPPCGWAEHEPLTDLAGVHEGFGVFLCNSAFQFGQWSTATHGGWRSGTRGYLNEAELGFALGIFCVRRQIDPELAMSHLKQNPGEVFWDSLDYVEELEKRESAP